MEKSGPDETKKSEDQSDVDESGGDETKESVDQTTESGSDECRGDETNDYQGPPISYFERNHTLRNSLMHSCMQISISPSSVTWPLYQRT